MSQRLFSQWLGAIRHWTIIGAKIVQVLCRHMGFLSHNELPHVNMRWDTSIRSSFLYHGTPHMAFVVGKQNISMWMTWNMDSMQILQPHYTDVIMSAMASEITSVSIVYSTVCSCANQRKHQRSASLVFVREIHRGPVNSPHKGPVTWKMFPSDDVIMRFQDSGWRYHEILQPSSLTGIQVHHCVPNSLPPSLDIWRQRFWSTMAQIMACCLTVPNQYQNQCWLKSTHLLILVATSPSHTPVGFPSGLQQAVCLCITINI